MNSFQILHWLHTTECHMCPMEHKNNLLNPQEKVISSSLHLQIMNPHLNDVSTMDTYIWIHILIRTNMSLFCYLCYIFSVPQKLLKSPWAIV